MSISGNMVGSYSQIGKTFIIQDQDGNEITGIVTGSEVIFTAGDNDVREGMVYASDSGVSTGTKNIPAYYARYGCKVFLANSQVIITVPEYDYKSILIVISKYNTKIVDSTASIFTSIDNGMYEVGNSTKISDIIIDAVNEQIDLGITVSEKSVLRYLVIREEY